MLRGRSRICYNRSFPLHQLLSPLLRNPLLVHARRFITSFKPVEQLSHALPVVLEAANLRSKSQSLSITIRMKPTITWELPPVLSKVLSGSDICSHCFSQHWRLRAALASQARCRWPEGGCTEYTMACLMVHLDGVCLHERTAPMKYQNLS